MSGELSWDGMDTMLLISQQRRAICDIAEAIGLHREGWHLETLPALVRERVQGCEWHGPDAGERTPCCKHGRAQK